MNTLHTGRCPPAVVEDWEVRYPVRQGEHARERRLPR
ncbi:hypothetical protein BJ971_003482 [Actinoplanes digitatis]|uniref:Uncharacterized protein n=1 Tax=Actinoplanes digitatis TaxID=1868 RepID=A0A7W7HYA5_9ACTN|nr:hypothetical protein [Actinoplanes digitatis]